ncbi:hypothetical protein [Roseivivax sediminis]|uniref:Uncharacterized protein n=1 Tax=Roseivivax sediminis TaxID=936889 RepID=A0A1I2BLR1_9RHOB|nr:hypothetical protein [Roseivivax sediminis]SFE57142.1 hypothetical protein SAMN04515678_111102 [Roseivivax sediminis]
MDITIRPTRSGDTEGPAYCEAIGFHTWRTLPGRICKRHDLAAPVPVDRPEAQP